MIMSLVILWAMVLTRGWWSVEFAPTLTFFFLVDWADRQTTL
jgi:hypothetical protein